MTDGASEPDITKAMVDAQAPLTREYFDTLWRGAAEQLRRDVEADVRSQIARRIGMRGDDAIQKYRQSKSAYYEGFADAYDISEQIAKGELDQ